jgi:hypothetical protein
MELLYVKEVHGYFEIFQKSLNSHIFFSKTAKWIWRTKIEKTFGKKEPFLILGHFLAQLSFSPWPLPSFRSPKAGPALAQAHLPVRHLCPREEAARWRCRGHPMRRLAIIGQD